MKYFITFEGIDGSGKSTISKLVYEKLRKMDYEVILTYEPTDTWIGKQVKKCIETGADPFITALTFTADRFEHVKQIQKWLDEKKIVLCDRYAESTYAYQGVQLQDFIKEPIKWLKALALNRIPVPDRTYIFLIEPKLSIKRIQNRENLIPFEKVSFLEKVHENYLKLAIGKQFMKIDASKKIDDLVDICLEDILS